MCTKITLSAIMSIVGFCLFVSGLVGIYHLKDGGIVVCGIICSCCYLTINGKTFGLWEPIRRVIGFATTAYGLYYIFV